ncbi:unnamed protein product, partial [Polarella glacialis]
MVLALRRSTPPQCVPVRHRRYGLCNDLPLAAAARCVKQLLHCPYHHWYCYLDRYLPLHHHLYSWVGAFEVVNKDGGDYAVQLTGVPSIDAYCYMDWLLTVPLLLMELILVMKLPQQETVSVSWKLDL